MTLHREMARPDLEWRPSWGSPRSRSGCSALSGATFEIAGPAQLDDDGIGGIEYVVTIGDFRNGGRWRARLTSDARFVWWAHQPFMLAGG